MSHYNDAVVLLSREYQGAKRKAKERAREEAAKIRKELENKYLLEALNEYNANLTAIRAGTFVPPPRDYTAPPPRKPDGTLDYDFMLLQDRVYEVWYPEDCEGEE